MESSKKDVDWSLVQKHQHLLRQRIFELETELRRSEQEKGAAYSRENLAKLQLLRMSEERWTLSVWAYALQKLKWRLRAWLA